MQTKAGLNARKDPSCQQQAFSRNVRANPNKASNFIVDVSDSSDDEPAAGPSRLRTFNLSSRTSSANSGATSSTRPSSILSAFDVLQSSPLTEEDEVPKPRFIPAPFPISLADDPRQGTSSSDQGHHSERSRHRPLLTSDSDRDRATLQKSPRKTKEHSSPRPKSQNNNGNTIPDRAESPTPIRQRAPIRDPAQTSTQPKLRALNLEQSVIEISSDSERELLDVKVAPLLLARAKLAGTASSRQTLLPPSPRRTGKTRTTQLGAKHKSTTRAVVTEDIIDLTSP